ncbi:MAG: phage/plasmid primase, P4 family [Pseudomonadota bacterium]
MTSVRRQIGEGGAVAPGGGGGTLRRGGTGLDAGVVRGAVNIADVAAKMLCIQLSKATNGELEGLCPLHDDHNPSFRINVRKQRWFCNSTCGGGDVFNLVEKVLGVDFPTALRRVAEFAGLGGVAVPGDNAELTIDPAKAAEAEQRAREAEAERERDEAKRRRRAVQAAQKTWGRAAGNRDHEHVRRYVEGRGVPVAALPEGKLPASVGYVADLPLPSKDQEEGAGEPGGPAIARGPAAVLRWTKRVVHPDGRHGTVVTGVQRIYLAEQGDGKRAGMADPKVTLGSVSQGGGIKLNRATDAEGVTLWVCEGPETGLALLAAVGTLPGGWASNEVWSLLAAPQVRHLALGKVPEAELGRRVSRLVIAGDLDKSRAGQKAAAAGAATVAAELAHVGLRGLCEVAVALPDHAAAGAELVDADGKPVAGKSVDWLDVVARHGVAEAGRRLADAAARGPVAVPVGDGEAEGAAGAGVAAVSQEDAEAAAAAVLEAAAGDGGGWGGGGDQDAGGWDERRDPEGRPILDDDRTLKARSMLRMRFAPCRANDLLPAEVDGAWRVQCYQSLWYIWHRDAKGGTRWVPISQDQMHAMATATFAQCVTWQKRRFRPAALAASGVDGVLKAAVYYVDAGVSPEDLPRWLPAAAGQDGRPSWRSPLDTKPTDEDRDRDVIAVMNGLVHVRDFLEGRPQVRPHTSRWFNTVCLPFTIAPERLATVANEDGEDLETVWREVCPRWMAFLAETFGAESQCIEALQRWFGYCLTADTSHQKVLYLQGLPGTGKGTIREVLTCILGEQNVHNATMDELAGRFDVAPMVGKAAVVIPEIEMDSKTSKAAALTRLKSITGGDPQSVERKHRERIGHVRIRAKFMLTPNTEPNLPDSSAALIRRLIVVPMGRPPAKVDPTLPEQLKAEATGILLWALVGLRRVRTAGGLLQPEEGRRMLEQMRRNMSPVRAFVDDWCVLGPGESCDCAVLRDGFGVYCERELGTDRWSAPAFGRALMAAVGGVQHDREGTGERAWVYTGIRPLLAGEDRAEPCKNVHVRVGVTFPGPVWGESSASETSTIF